MEDPEEIEVELLSSPCSVVFASVEERISVEEVWLIVSDFVDDDEFALEFAELVSSEFDKVIDESISDVPGIVVSAEDIEDSFVCDVESVDELDVDWVGVSVPLLDVVSVVVFVDTSLVVELASSVEELSCVADELSSVEEEPAADDVRTVLVTVSDELWIPVSEETTVETSSVLVDVSEVLVDSSKESVVVSSVVVSELTEN